MSPLRLSMTRDEVAPSHDDYSGTSCRKLLNNCDGGGDQNHIVEDATLCFHSGSSSPGANPDCPHVSSADAGSVIHVCNTGIDHKQSEKKKSELQRQEDRALFSVQTKPSTRFPPREVGVTEKVYEEAKSIWAWGRHHLVLLGDVMGVMEHVADQVVHHMGGTNLEDFDHGFVQPHLQAMDKDVVAPAIHLVARFVQDASHQIAHAFMRPILEQLSERPAATLTYHTFARNNKDTVDKDDEFLSGMDGLMRHAYSSGTVATNDTEDEEDEQDENLSSADVGCQDAAFFIGYDEDDDLTDSWGPLFPAPPNSPVEPDYFGSDMMLDDPVHHGSEFSDTVPFAYASY